MHSLAPETDVRDIDEDLSTEGLLRGARAPQAGLRS